VDGSSVTEIWPFAYIGGIWMEPTFWGGCEVAEGVSDDTIRKSDGSFL